MYHQSYPQMCFEVKESQGHLPNKRVLEELDFNENNLLLHSGPPTGRSTSENPSQTNTI